MDGATLVLFILCRLETIAVTIAVTILPTLADALAGG